MKATKQNETKLCCIWGNAGLKATQVHEMKGVPFLISWKIPALVRGCAGLLTVRFHFMKMEWGFYVHFVDHATKIVRLFICSSHAECMHWSGALLDYWPCEWIWYDSCQTTFAGSVHGCCSCFQKHVITQRLTRQHHNVP